MSLSIYIRPIDIPDALKVMEWENNPDNWDASDNKSEYALYDIVRLIEELRNIELAKQARWIICEASDEELIGTVDLFEIDFEKKEASVGVLVADKLNRRKGIASQALNLIEQEALNLGLTRLTCIIHPHNQGSICLFEKQGFGKIGITDDKFLNEGVYLEALIYEKWLKK